MNGGRHGGRSPPRPHLFGGLNFPVVSEEGNTSILRSNADQEQEDKPMRLKHKVRINIADKSGNKQEVLQSEHRSIPKRLSTRFCPCPPGISALTMPRISPLEKSAR